MQKNKFRKGLVLAVIVLFVGTSIVQGLIDNSGLISDNISTENLMSDYLWDTDWRYRKQITINHSYVDANLTNFPVLVVHTSSNFSNNAQPDGDDFVFIDGNDVKLNHEIEYYNSTYGELIAWVNLTLLSSTDDTVFYIYYGNLNCNNQENVEETWSNHYVAVYHMNDLSITTIADSTENLNHGVKANLSLEQDGKIGKAQDFERDNNQYIVVSDDDSLDLNGNYTHEHWINTETLDANGYILYKGGYYGSSVIDYSCSFQGDNQYNSQSWDLTHNPICYTGIGTISSTETWYYTATTSDKGQIGGYKAFLNGTLMDADDEDTTLISNEYDLQIGRRTGALQLFFDGLIDEIRISDIPRSKEWINTSYNNQNDPESFMSFGEQEFFNYPPDAPTITGPTDVPPGTYEYTFKAIDPDGDDVYYWIDWGDGNGEETDFHASGEEVKLNHTFLEIQVYLVGAKAIDTYNYESEWGHLEVTIPKNKPFFHNFPLLNWLLERFPLLQRLFTILEVYVL